MKEKKEVGSALPVHAEVMTKNKALIAKIKASGASILAEVKALLIKDDAARERAAELRAQAKKLNKEVDAKFDQARDAAWKIYNFVKDGIADMKVDADKAVKILDRAMSDYDLEKDRKAKEAEAKAQAEAEALKKKEQEKLNAKAEKAEAKGNEEQAAILREQAENVQVFVPTGVSAPEKTTRTETGTTSGSKDFDVVIVEGMTVLRHVAAGTLEPGVVRIKRDAQGYIAEMVINPTTIKKVAEMKVIGDVLPVIPGCKMIPKVSYGSRTGNGK